MKLAVRSTSAHPWRRAHNLLAAAVTISATPALPPPVVFHVSSGDASTTAVSGRMLIFAKLLGPADKRPVTWVDMDQIDTHATAIAAREAPRLEHGATVDVDADVTAFPTPFSQLKPGHYAVQAVLDRDHSYNYTGRGPGDLVSGVVEMDLPGDATQLLTLATVVPEADPLQPLSNVPAALRDVYTAAKADIHPIDFASPALSSFWGRPIVLHGWVMTPPTMRRIPTNAIQNKNHGDVFTEGLHGKRFSLLIENEIWWRAVSLLSVGSEIRVSHDVSAIDGRLLIYPTVGIRYLF